MPGVDFGVTATWNHNDFISICFSISTCEAGAAGERPANLYEAVKRGGRIDRKLAFKYQVGNMCFFNSKNAELTGQCRGRGTLRVSAEVQLAPGGPLHMHRIGSLLEVQT